MPSDLMSFPEVSISFFTAAVSCSGSSYDRLDERRTAYHGDQREAPRYSPAHDPCVGCSPRISVSQFGGSFTFLLVA